MTNNSVNEKTFTLILNKTRNFTLRIVNFAVNTSLRILLHISTIDIATTLSQRIRNLVYLIVPSIIIESTTKLITRFTSALSLKTVILTTILKTINRETSNIIFHLGFVTTLRRNLRTLVNMNDGFVDMVFSVIVAVLYKLSDWDGSTLATLDSNTLGQMDHT